MSPRPLMAAVAAQQRQIARLTHENQVLALQLGYVASLAGVSRQVEAIRKKADLANPAQPVPDPPSEGPFETTEQAATPEAYDDVRNPGMTPGSVQDVTADTTDVALNPGVSLPTSPFNELQDVQAPIAGTETHVPDEQTRIETDVRVGDPMAPGVAYPWDISPNQSNASRHTASTGNRTIAAIQLARLQIEAGLASGNDLSLGAQIESSPISDQEITSTIATLSSVKKAASRQVGRPGGLVPRSAGVARTTPSLAGGSGMGALASTGTGSDDTADADLFD